MARITELMIRKRAEHNEGMLSTLQEVTLHQHDIEKIEVLGDLCKDLRILYLQHNLISKMENLKKLKYLQYLNLALNNIEVIEGVECCEDLEKLDLTVNFVDDLRCVANLQGNFNLRELYLTGNPCTKYDFYRPYVIAMLPQLARLDGDEVEKSERIRAVQNLAANQAKVDAQAVVIAEMKEQKAREAEAKGEEAPDGERLYGHTPEDRLAMHRALEEDRRKNGGGRDEEKPKKEAPPRGCPPVLRGKDGHIMNRNEHKWDFRIDDDLYKQDIVVSVVVGKHVDTSLLDVNIEPEVVQVTFKGRTLQLALPEEVNPDKAKAQRSLTTGELVLTCPKVKEVVVPVRKDDGAAAAKGKPDAADGEGKLTDEALDAAAAKANVDVAGIVERDEDGNVIGAGQRARVKLLDEELGGGGRTIREEVIPSADFVDDPDVPPLE